MSGPSGRRVPSLAAGVAAVIALGALAACGASKSDSGSATGGGASSLAGVTLTLGDQANGLKTLADAAGVLKDTPYKVKWAEFQGAAPLFQAMQGGSVDTGVAADLPSLQAISGGLPIKLVAATQANGAGTGIIVRANSSVHSVADLKGKDVVVSSARGSIAEYLLAKALQDNGLKYSDVKVSYVLPTAAQAAFSSGKIDVWAIFGVYQATALQQGARLVVDGQDGRTSGVGFISAASSSLADPKKKAAIADFLQRLARAETWSATHADDYAKVYTDKNGVPAAVAKVVVAQSATALVPVSADVVTKVQAVSDLMHGIGALPTAVQVASVVDASAFTGASATATPAS